MTTRRLTRATVRSPKIQRPLTLAVISDLHNGAYADMLPIMRKADGILVVGDLLDRHHLGYANAAAFLQDAPACAPTFYAIGNHEWKSVERDEFWPLVKQSGVTVLDNRFVPFGGILLGGLSSAAKRNIDTGVVDAMAQADGFRLLMCHHPEWYGRYVADRNMDLTVSGHAHGGQIQFFGRGMYAPGQGLFPRLTDGFYHGGHLLVSRGMTNACTYPRWFNPCEMILLRLEPGKEYGYEIGT